MLQLSPFSRRSLLAAATLLALCAGLSCDSGRSSGLDPVGPPAELELVSGNNQEGEVGTRLPQPLVVRVTDDEGRPIAGQVINFRVVEGNGSVFAGAAQTNAEGIAQELWTLGTSTSDSQRVEVRAVDATTGEPLVFATFRATARPGPAVGVQALAGSGQSAPIGDRLTDSLVARVVDRFGNGVPDVSLAWSATAGGVVSPGSPITDETGRVGASWALGLRVDSSHIATVRSDGLAPVPFTATATLPATARLRVESGDGQRGAIGTRLTDSIAIVASLADGRPIGGVIVTFTAAAGAGTVAPGVDTTTASGRAVTYWTLPSASGTKSLSATAPGFPGLLLTATADAGPPASAEAIGLAPASWNLGEALPESLGVRVRDQQGNPVARVEVEWTVLGGGGTVSPARPRTDANGVARAMFSLGTRMDVQFHTVRAVIPGFAPFEFPVAPTIPASAIVATSGSGQTAEVGTALPESLSVTFRLADGRPIVGLGVHWTGVTDDDGTVSGTPRTDENGVSRGLWMLGPRTGVRRALASLGGRVPEFTATARVGPFAGLQLAGGQSAAARAPIGVTVTSTDRFGNVVPGIEVAWSVLEGGGSVSPETTTTGADGKALVQWTLGPSAGLNRLQASANGAAPVTHSATASEGVGTLTFTRVAVGLTGATLRDVWGSSANNVWAVGDSGVVLHYDGTSWSRVASGTMMVLTAVHGTAANDVWFGGGDLTLPPSSPRLVIRRFDGTVIGDVSTEGLPLSNAITSIWLAPDGRAHVTTTSGGGIGGQHIFRLNGTTWQSLGEPLYGQPRGLYTCGAYQYIWGYDALNLWAAAGPNSTPCSPNLSFYNGTWHFAANAHAVWGPDPSLVFGVNDSQVWKFDRTINQFVQFWSVTGSRIWGSSASDIYVTGTTLFHFDGVNWGPVGSVGGHDVWVSPSGSDVFVVGGGGTIFHGRR